MDSLIFKDGLRIGKHELDLLQTTQKEALSDAMVAMTGRVPAILANKNPDGTLSNALRVDISATTGNVTVRAGSAVFPSGAVITVPETELTVGTNAGNRDIVLTTQTVYTLPGLVTITTTGGVTTVSGFTSPEKYYSVNSYIRLVKGATVYGTFRIASINDGAGTMVLADAIIAPVPITDVEHGVAGKFFPGYPLGVETTNILARETYLLQVLEPLAGVPAAGSSQILLARVNRVGSGAVTLVTDYRDQQLLSPNIGGVQITNANVANTAAIAESKIALSTATTEAQTMRHTQNTDTHTTASAFYVGGPQGTGKRVVTTDDINIPAGSPAATTVPDITAEPEFGVQFIRVSGTLASAHVAFGTGGNVVNAVSAGATQTITLELFGPRNIGSNTLANRVIYDSTGAYFAITANSAVNIAANSTGQVTITASRTDLSTNTLKTFTLGQGCVYSSAASRFLQVFADSAGSPTGAPLYELAVPNPASFNLPTFAALSFNGVEGTQYHYRLTSSRAGKTSFVQTINKIWGDSGVAAGAGLNIGVISTTANTTYATFAWNNPSGYDPNTMDYAISVQRRFPGGQLSPLTPFYKVYASGDGFTEFAGGTANLNVVGAKDEIIEVSVRVVDLSGNFKDTVPATAQVQIPSVDLSAYNRMEIPFKDIRDADFINSAGILNVPLRELEPVYDSQVYIGGIGLIIDSFSGDASAQFKAITYPDLVYANGYYSSEFTTKNHSPGAGTTPTVSITTGGAATFSTSQTLSVGSRFFANGIIFRVTAVASGTSYTVATLPGEPNITTGISGATFTILTPLSNAITTFAQNGVPTWRITNGISVALEKIGAASITHLSGKVVVFYSSAL